MTRFGKMFLKEFSLGNFFRLPHPVKIAQFKISQDDSSVLQIVWVRNTFVNIRPSCSRSGSCRRARLRNDWQLCDSSTSKLSRKPGASPRRPIRKEHFTFLRSLAGKRSRDSSTQL